MFRHFWEPGMQNNWNCLSYYAPHSMQAAYESYGAWFQMSPLKLVLTN